MKSHLLEFSTACEQATVYTDLQGPLTTLTLAFGFSYFTLSIRSAHEMQQSQISTLPEYVIGHHPPSFTSTLKKMQNKSKKAVRDFIENSPVFRAIVDGKDTEIWHPDQIKHPSPARVFRDSGCGWSITLTYAYEFLWGGLVFLFDDTVSESTAREIIAFREQEMKLARSLIFHTCLTKKLALPINPLSPLQQEILQKTAEGLSDKPIAEELELETERTVKTEKTNIRRLLGAKNTSEAIYIACKLNYL